MTFDATAAALEATTKDQTVTSLVMVTPPPPVPEVESPTEENIAREREEAHAQSLVTTMSGWLRRDGSEGPKSSTSQEGSAASRVGGKIASLFSGFGRKTAPTVATEATSDVSGMAESRRDKWPTTTDGGKAAGQPWVSEGTSLPVAMPVEEPPITANTSEDTAQDDGGDALISGGDEKPE